MIPFAANGGELRKPSPKNCGSVVGHATAAQGQPCSILVPLTLCPGGPRWPEPARACDRNTGRGAGCCAPPPPTTTTNAGIDVFARRCLPHFGSPPAKTEQRVTAAPATRAGEDTWSIQWRAAHLQIDAVLWLQHGPVRTWDVVPIYNAFCEALVLNDSESNVCLR